ncbi:MAG: SDR family oxidoreductase [Deltaproteobacteria bacterium]|nr:SDR family oxidoreductase [Deltaproteobacteria bacterium]
MRDWFRDKVAWVTGAGSGIGREIALELGRQGAAVAVSGRRPDRLEDVTAAIEALGVPALSVPCDVRAEPEVAAAVARVVERFGRLDVAVANAGVSVNGRVADLDAEQWRRQLDTNVVGVALTARHALGELRKQGGRLCLVGSVAGFVTAPGFGAYHASKYAVRALGQTLAMELHGTGTSCTAVHPGFVESEIAQVDGQGRFDPSRPDRRPRKLMWPAERAGRAIVRALCKRKREVVFTGHGHIVAWAGMHVPWLVHLLMTRSAMLRRAARAGGREE